ncbi:MAG: DnaD domain protein [Firmicutes bacterium]|nr:DnaD domain protein [Bacillota bacterium]
MADPKMEDVFALYQQKVALLSSAQKEKLCAAHDEGMTPFVIGCAILRAVQEQRRSRLQGKNKRISFNYIYRIIEDWLNHGIITDEHFYTYWSDIHQEQASVGGDGRVETKRKVRREDFTYRESKQDRSLFAWLDE